jgi:hypothetical protein
MCHKKRDPRGCILEDAALQLLTVFRLYVYTQAFCYKYAGTGEVFHSVMILFFVKSLVKIIRTLLSSTNVSRSPVGWVI